MTGGVQSGLQKVVEIERWSNKVTQTHFSTYTHTHIQNCTKALKSP